MSACFTASLLVIRRLTQYSASSCSTRGGRRTVRVMRGLRCNTANRTLYYDRLRLPRALVQPVQVVVAAERRKAVRRDENGRPHILLAYEPRRAFRDVVAERFPVGVG